MDQPKLGSIAIAICCGDPDGTGGWLAAWLAAAWFAAAWAAARCAAALRAAARARASSSAAAFLTSAWRAVTRAVRSLLTTGSEVLPWLTAPATLAESPKECAGGLAEALVGPTATAVTISPAATVPAATARVAADGLECR